MVGQRVVDGDRRGTVVDREGDSIRVIWDDGDTQWCQVGDVQVVGA